MYSAQQQQQQQQPPLQAQSHVSTNTLQQVVDDVSGPLYHQRHVSDYQPSNTTNPPTIHQLAEFVSTMIYLLWHVRRSSVLALHSASRHGSFTTLSVNQGDTASLLQRSDAAFQKFCQQVLTATQLSESVVMLSLKYIAKLLQTNPNIQGAQGSEYRLFVVALLLANKFHDDNTFTNKTWADVSGMKLHELDIMELEFLGVLDFGLFIRKEEFDNWKTGLLMFMAQLQNTTLMQTQHQNQQQAMDATLYNMGLLIPTPDPTWHSPTNNISTQQQQYLYLLSTTQPEFIAQSPSNVPLQRVPLRIPSYPVHYNNMSSREAPTATTSSADTALLTNSVSLPTSSSFTPMYHAMYQPLPPSQHYQQQQQVTHMPIEPSFHTHATAIPSSLTYPAPARTSNRTIPRNMSTSSLAALAQSNNNPYNDVKSSSTATTTKSKMVDGIHPQQQHLPYQHQNPISSAMLSDNNQSLVDYYAWKSLTEKKDVPQQSLHSQSTPYYQKQQQR